MNRPRIVSRDEWLVARKQHLGKENELTRLRDQVSAERRTLPGSGPDITIDQRPPEKQGDMKTLFWQMNATLDGFIEGPNQELDYAAHVVDEDFDGYAKCIHQFWLGIVTT